MDVWREEENRTASTLDHSVICNYCYYMKTAELKVTAIGNSRGVRLPADSLKRYRVGATLIMEERSDGILLRPPGPAVEKLSWEDTACEMAVSNENWSDWETTAGDGLGTIVWGPAVARKVAEGKAVYKTNKPRVRPS